jgi:hypothetical protein
MIFLDCIDSIDSDENPQQSKRGVTYGTGLGHTSNNNDYRDDREKAFAKLFGKRDLKREYSDYEWKNVYDALYRDNPQQQKRAGFSFGTALGHNQGGDSSNYVNSVNQKFHELFGDSS